jgi:uncharacterized protein
MSKYTGPVVDVDVHQLWNQPSDVQRYLPKRWQDYYLENNPHAPIPLEAPSITNFSMIPSGGLRHDTWRDHGFPGSDYGVMRTDLLDRYNHYRTLLTYSLGEQSAILNPYLATEVCRALTEWCIEEWLPRDDRFYTCIVAPSGQPEVAAKEIRRLGDNPRIVGVLLSANPLNRPFGDPNYHPIYEACAEMDLAVVFHPSSSDLGHIKANIGTPGSTIEFLASTFATQGMHTVSSLVSHGVFEKYPTLKVLVLEYGIGWLPGLMWRMDHNVKQLQAEVSGLKRMPSEYVLEHFKFATQPLEEFARHSDLIKLLSTVDGIEDILCFSSDYPHISTDDADYVARIFPDSWRERVFYRNACAMFDWPLPESEAMVAPSEALAGAR